MNTLEKQLDKLLNVNVESAIDSEKTFFDHLIDLLKYPLVLYGAGNLGRKALAGLRQVGVEPLAFCDNNHLLWGKLVDGLLVLHPKEATMKYGKNTAFIITVWSPGKERSFNYIKDYLTNLGCAKISSFIPLFWKYPDFFLPHYRIDLPHYIYEEANAIKEAFCLLADDFSRLEYLQQIKWLLNSEVSTLTKATYQDVYFPEDLFKFNSSEVFIDCGAFDGDTIRNIIKNYKKAFYKIFAFEPDPINYLKLKQFIATLPNDIGEKIYISQKAVGLHKGKLYFEALGTVSSSISEKGSLEIEVISIDEYMENITPTYIKMDIEGSEPEALAGARVTISNNSPIIAFCVYHRQNHLWTLPLYVNSLSSDYKFYLRRYDDEFGDVVCYAIPIRRLT